ncbi:hypothetical protein LIA77_10162 [Sarocladium implicatum]|nr:hypothetical protein LIA77_10162 [Sarocladium implicatum]
MRDINTPEHKCQCVEMQKNVAAPYPRAGRIDGWYICMHKPTKLGAAKGRSPETSSPCSVHSFAPSSRNTHSSSLLLQPRHPFSLGPLVRDLEPNPFRFKRPRSHCRPS